MPGGGYIKGCSCERCSKIAEILTTADGPGDSSLPVSGKISLGRLSREDQLIAEKKDLLERLHMTQQQLTDRTIELNKLRAAVEAEGAEKVETAQAEPDNRYQREMSLQLAVGLHSSRELTGVGARFVILETAKLFEAYLTGERS